VSIASIFAFKLDCPLRAAVISVFNNVILSEALFAILLTASILVFASSEISFKRVAKFLITSPVVGSIVIAPAT